MKLITISGLDGSGKSTQLEMIKNSLESKGQKVFCYHAIRDGFAKKFMDFRQKYCILCRLFNKCKVKNGEKSVTQASWPKIMLRRIFLMIDIIRFKRLRKKLIAAGYNYLLSDRYFYDSVVNIKYLSKKNKKLPCEKFILKPDVSLYLQTNPEIIMQRDRKPDQGKKYLEDKKKLYDDSASIWDLKIIDRNSNKEDIFEKIKKAITT